MRLRDGGEDGREEDGTRTGCSRVKKVRPGQANSNTRGIFVCSIVVNAAIKPG